MIEKLTATQENKLTVYRDKGLQIGLDTSPINFNKCKTLVKKAYKAAKLNPPQHICYAPDCVAAVYMIGYAQSRYPNGPSASAATLQKELNQHMDKPSGQRPTGMDAYWCQPDAGWLAWGNYYEEILGLKFSHPNLKLERELIGSCYALYVWKGLAVVVDRLKEIHLEGAILHNEKGAALVGRGPLRVWAFQGVRVSEKVIIAPKTLAVDEIKAENNEEVRRVMISRFGAAEYLEAIGAKILDEGSLTLEGSGPRTLFEGSDGTKWMRCTDGSSAEIYYLPAPRNAKTCQEAHEMLQGGAKESDLIAEA